MAGAATEGDAGELREFVVQLYEDVTDWLRAFTVPVNPVTPPQNDLR
jgi:hypothetical protein